ncbi:MAG: tRNA (adenosine(37)-N6)-threonylcarbamoyltransferase complex transferase subunit TsaD [Bacteroidia bacterium]|nr:tRNA (adenosine(37)-N6)-threonylcarbamoyltransferase complex transferase subunit TsaD [Bacteroidia bacterium]MDW8334154.1 tRNA (adenosine(37)-N6)-threonylcarbamoyltransferase complex transferase subunit TsaD [Bacteroidia bacterium]
MKVLGIETSCDDTAAAVCDEGKILSNVVGRQSAHECEGGVIPELASRLHDELIVPTVEAALSRAGVAAGQINATAYTAEPGLPGALHVGTAFARGFASALGVPAVAVNHLHAHLLSVFLTPPPPKFPFMALTVSGGHTELTLVRDFFDYRVVGRTLDDAAGEAFDKTARMLGFAYPGGPLLDACAESGTPTFSFPRPNVKDWDFSFSGLKTAVLYFLRSKDPDFIERHKADLCASIRKTIVDFCLSRLFDAAQAMNIRHVAVVGGVSANRLLRRELIRRCEQADVHGHIPAFEYCTDNAAMVAFTGFKWLEIHGHSPRATHRGR